MAIALLVVLPAVAVAQSGIIVGSDGGDELVGTSGPDTIFALAGDDALNGGAGDDDLDGGAGADDLRGGAGTDAVLYGDRTTAVAVTLDDAANDGSSEADNVHADVEQIFGGSAADHLTGSGEGNLIDGAGGNDTIDPKKGDDRVYGGDGNDTITTIDGDIDIIDCGAGNDTITADATDRAMHCETSRRAPSVAERVVSIPTSGGIKPRAGVPRRLACRGTMSLTLLKRAQVLARKSLRLNARCRWSFVFRVRSQRLAGVQTLRLRQRFSGNAYVAPGASTRTVKVPRT